MNAKQTADLILSAMKAGLSPFGAEIRKQRAAIAALEAKVRALEAEIASLVKRSAA
jgi:cell division protein FtsB